MKFILLSLFVFIASCTSTPSLNKKQKEVIFMKPKAGECKLIDDDLHVVAFFYRRSSEVLKNKLMIKAERIGGNVIELVALLSGSDQAIAKVYKCPEHYINEYKRKLKTKGILSYIFQYFS